MAKDTLMFRNTRFTPSLLVLLLGFVLAMAFAYVIHSGNRSFNFDEFQALYESAALERGKLLYVNQIGFHFPFFNIILTFLIHIAGFQTITILIIRYFVLSVNTIALIFIYKIGKIAWDKRTGMVALCLTLSAMVFLDKGIEIRHDVFNTAFNVMGAYYGLQHLKRKRNRYLVISSIFLGLAFASTQKALVWNAGIIIGLLMYYVRDRSFKKSIWIVLLCVIVFLGPLVISFIYLKLRYGEDVYIFLKNAVAIPITFFSPHTQELYPFPYSRYSLLMELVFQNHLLYALAIGGMCAVIVSWVKHNTERIVIVVWAMVGVLFYVTVKRPFFQTFLPSVPPLALLAAGVLSDIWDDLRGLDFQRAIAVGIATVALLFVWPLVLAWSQVYDKPKMERQMANVSFCLENLQNQEKVLCFSQNQVFFDPVLGMNWFGTEKNPWDYDPDWFEKRMIAEQCRVIINDYRTGLLNKEVKRRIEENYIATKTGDILVPGFVIPPSQPYAKKVWIAGDYYSPTTSLEIDGNMIQGNVIHLEQKEYAFRNLTDRRVILVHVFDTSNFMNLLPKFNRIH